MTPPERERAHALLDIYACHGLGEDDRPIRNLLYRTSIDRELDAEFGKGTLERKRASLLIRVLYPRGGPAAKGSFSLSAKGRSYHKRVLLAVARAIFDAKDGVPDKTREAKEGLNHDGHLS